MKLLEIDYEYFKLPEGMSCVDDFMTYANDHYPSFIGLVQYKTDDCVFPYLVQEDTQTKYVNIANCNYVCEVEATIYNRKEYDVLLERVVKQKCLDCVNYKEDSQELNLSGHRDKLCLNGECVLYQKVEED